MGEGAPEISSEPKEVEEMRDKGPDFIVTKEEVENSCKIEPWGNEPHQITPEEEVTGVINVADTIKKLQDEKRVKAEREKDEAKRNKDL